MRGKADGIYSLKYALDDFIHKAQARFDVEAIIVFGSRAGEDHLECSDLDLAVISEGFRDLPPFRRTELLLELWGGNVALDALGYTPEEFDSTESLLLLDLMEYGRALVDRGIFSKARSLYHEKLDRGEIRRLDGGYELTGRTLNAPAAP
jgi:predicted nucleotidyltransferase